MSNERKSQGEPALNHVCLFFVHRDGKVMLEPSESPVLGKVLKPMSHKFKEEPTVAEALSELGKKYHFSGIYNSEEKISKTGSFNIGKKIFHAFSIQQNKGNISSEGKFRFVRTVDLKKVDRINLPGYGEYAITDSIKKALNIN